MTTLLTPVFMVTVRQHRQGLEDRARVCRITTPRGLKRSIECARAHEPGCRASAEVPQAFADRFGLKQQRIGPAPTRSMLITRSGAIVCEGRIR